MSYKRIRDSTSSSSESEDDDEKRTLFVANIHPKTTEEILYELFLQAGPIETVKIPKDKASNRQKSFGFVRYKYQSAIPYAVRLYEDVKLFGQRLTVKARNLKESNESMYPVNLNQNLYQDNTSSLRQGFRMNTVQSSMMMPMQNPNRSDNLASTKVNLEKFARFAPELVAGIHKSFDGNPFRRDSEKPFDKQIEINKEKNSYRNDFRYNNRDKPYDKHAHKGNSQYLQRNSRRAEQRRQR